MKIRGLPEPYKIKVKRKRGSPIFASKPIVVKEKEQLYGFVRDMAASDIEERFARALDKLEKNYWFRLPVGAPRGMPGYNEVDFLVASGGYYPIQIDGEYSHIGREAKDMLTDAKVMVALREYNPFPVKHILYTSLGNQRAADMAARELFG